MNAEPENPTERRDDLHGRTRSGSDVFATTHWSVVLAAGDQPSPEAAVALERLCQTYWYPLYAYLRRRGHSEHDAQDLTQAFFAHLLERQAFHRLSPAKGKFRSFLLAALSYFLRDERARASAQKRGGGRPVISFQAAAAEDRFRLEPVDRCSPEVMFERRWALTMLDQVMARLQEEFVSAGRAEQFERLSGYLVRNSGDDSYAVVARDLKQSEQAVKKAVQRMRTRYYAIFREEIANTVATPADVAEELRHLCEVMAQP